MPPLTMVEKILAKRTGKTPSPGEHIVIPVDYVYMHDGTFPLALRVLREMGLAEKIDPSRLILFIDHAAPAPSVAAALVHREMRRFASLHGVRLYDVGRGISHQVMVEEGYARPWRIILGADSHTVTLGAVGSFATGVGSTDAAAAAVSGRIWIRVPEQLRVRITGSELPRGVMGKDAALLLVSTLGANGAIYKAIEFHGELEALSLSARLTISNMVVEAGAKAGIFPVDALAAKSLREEYGIEVPLFYPDPGAAYEDELELDIASLEPLVAAPPRVDNVRAVAEVEGIEVDQVFIGSCTNGRYEDFAAAARILKARRVREGVRCIAVPASRQVFQRLERDGVIRVLAEAGCVVTYGTCGPCLGAHFGLLAEGEVAVSTSNRNFIGRMGHRDSKIYLASPLTAAAAAVTGRITDPRELLR